MKLKNLYDNVNKLMDLINKMMEEQNIIINLKESFNNIKVKALIDTDASRRVITKK